MIAGARLLACAVYCALCCVAASARAQFPFDVPYVPTPQVVVDRTWAETAKALQQADMKAIWDSQGATAGGQKPEEFAAYVKEETKWWTKAVKDAGIEPE